MVFVFVVAVVVAVAAGRAQPRRPPASWSCCFWVRLGAGATVVLSRLSPMVGSLHSCGFEKIPSVGRVVQAGGVLVGVDFVCRCLLLLLLLLHLISASHTLLVVSIP